MVGDSLLTPGETHLSGSICGSYEAEEFEDVVWIPGCLERAGSDPQRRRCLVSSGKSSLFPNDCAPRVRRERPRRETRNEVACIACSLASVLTVQHGALAHNASDALQVRPAALVVQHCAGGYDRIASPLYTAVTFLDRGAGLVGWPVPVGCVVGPMCEDSTHALM